jgi:hypothetical protein
MTVQLLHDSVETPKLLTQLLKEQGNQPAVWLVPMKAGKISLVHHVTETSLAKMGWAGLHGFALGAQWRTFSVDAALMPLVPKQLAAKTSDVTLPSLEQFVAVKGKDDLKLMIGKEGGQTVGSLKGVPVLFHVYPRMIQHMKDRCNGTISAEGIMWDIILRLKICFKDLGKDGIDPLWGQTLQKLWVIHRQWSQTIKMGHADEDDEKIAEAVVSRHGQNRGYGELLREAFYCKRGCTQPGPPNNPQNTQSVSLSVSRWYRYTGSEGW